MSDRQLKYVWFRHFLSKKWVGRSVDQSDLEYYSINQKLLKWDLQFALLVSIHDSTEILKYGKRESRLSESKFLGKMTVGRVKGARHISVARLISEEQTSHLRMNTPQPWATTEHVRSPAWLRKSILTGHDRTCPAVAPKKYYLLLITPYNLKARGLCEKNVWLFLVSKYWPLRIFIFSRVSIFYF